MTDSDERFRAGLRQAVANRPPLAVDLDDVVARAREGAPAAAAASARRAPRWLAAVAALALLAGVGVAAWLGRAPAPGMPAAPAPLASPSVSSSETPSTLRELLPGTWWSATEVSGEPVPGGAEGELLTLRFEDGTVTAADPCGTIAYDFRQAGDEFTFREVAPAVQSCAKSEKRQHSGFREALALVAAGEVEGQELRLRDPDGRVILRLADRTSSTSDEPEETSPPDPSASSRVGVRYCLPDQGSECVGSTPGAAPSIDAVAAGVVLVRLRNDTGLDIDRSLLVLPDGMRVEHESLTAGAATDYVDTAGAYRYAWLEVVAAGRTYGSKPADYVGEKPLAPGRYTYVVGLKGGKLTLGLETDR